MMLVTTLLGFLGVTGHVALPGFDAGLVSKTTRAYGECAPCNPRDYLCDKWGSGVLRRSRVYEGSGYQMIPFFEKIRAGEDVLIEVLGEKFRVVGSRP